MTVVYPTRLLPYQERINPPDPFSIYERYHVDSLKELTPIFTQDAPEIGSWDVEGTGLHIKKDHPFLIGIAWKVFGEEKGRVATFLPTHENMMTFISWGKRLKQFWFWNGKYDLHMLANIGYEPKFQNLCEGMVLARLTTEAKSARDGGDKVALKNFATKYVDPTANEAEKKLNKVITEAQKLHRKELASALKQLGWSMTRLKEFLKDSLVDEYDLPEDVREVYLEWKKQYPKTAIGDKDYLAGYKLNTDVMIHYLQNDCILTLESARYALPVLVGREQIEVMKTENKRILKLLSVERVGLLVDRGYLKQSKDKVRSYIKQKRERLHQLMGVYLKVGQHQAIKNYFQEEFNITLEASDEKNFKDLIGEKRYHPSPEHAKEVARQILELRTLEKWYSTYIVRMIDITEYDGRFYTQLNQASAVSGRFTSDAQQFPKKAIYTTDGEELFHARRVFIAPEGYIMILIDFSQQELRVQADYTIDVMGGDFNLCNAYIPFKCKHYKTDEEYDFSTPESRARWKELREGYPVGVMLEELFKQGWSAWITPEGKPWVPTDVHSQTGHNLLMELGYTCIEKFKYYQVNETTIPFFGETPNWKDVRNLAKSFNFMANYGGSKKSAMGQLNLPEVVAEKLVRAYYLSFPGVNDYQRMIMRVHAMADRGWVGNRYGRRYYLFSMQAVYRLANYCVQGTSADQTKETMDRLYDCLEDTQSMMVLTVHDEVIFFVKNGEEHIVPELQAIMEDHPWCKIPFVAEISWTKTSWAEKKGWNEYPCTELLSA